MSTPLQTPITAHNGNGATTVFAYNWLIDASSEMVAVVNGVTQTLGVDYTVSGVGSSTGGSVTFTVAPSSGTRNVVLYRNTPISRLLIQYQTSGDLLASVVNSDFDRIYRILQDLASVFGARSLRAPLGEELSDLPNAQTRANNVLVFNASGNATAVPASALAGTVSRRTLVANGGAASYTLEADPGGVSNTLVAVSGVVQTPGVDYTVSGTTLTPTTPWASGTGNVVIVYGVPVPIGNVDAGNISYSPTATYDPGTAGSRLNDTLTTTGFASLQAAVTAAAGKTLHVRGTHTITAAVTVPDNTVIVLDAGSVVQTSTADISHFNCTGRSNVQILGPGKIRKTGTGTAAYVAGVLLDGASHCLVQGVEFEGMQWSGVYMKNAVNCHAIRNWVHDHLGTVQDAAGISLLASCQDCSVEGNRIASTGWHGVLVQDADSTVGVFPRRCRVVNNVISGTTAYGVACYELTAEDTDTLIQGNHIRDVTGTNPTGSGGAGIYVQNSGGVRVVSNFIRNVCTATSSAVLTPAGISCNNIGGTLAQTVITGNTVTQVAVSSAGATNNNAILFSGINVSSSANGALVVGNTVRQNTALGTATFAGIYCNASSNFEAVGNQVQLPSTGAVSVGYFVFANGSSINTVSLSNNHAAGGTSAYLQVDTTGAPTTSSLSVSGFVGRGSSSAARGVQLVNVQGYSLTGVQIDCGTEALFANNSTLGRISACRFETAGATAILTSGTCTNSRMDASNFWGGSAGKVNNAGTGFVIEWSGATAAPAAGTWAVGDRTIRVPAVGSPRAWVCTTAGTPGTHTSEGNL
jgi:hypothetical protein